MMFTPATVRRRYLSELETKQDRFITMLGILGRVSDGTVVVSSRPGYVYVRIGHEERLGQARNKHVPNRYNLPVIVGWDGIDPEFQVLSIRQGDYLGAGFGEIPEVAPHHSTHEWPTDGDEYSDGSDAVYVHWRQIRGLRLKVVSAFTVQVERAPLYRSDLGRNVWVVEQSLDLGGDTPGAGARYVLVYLDANSDIQRRLGPVVSKAALDFEAHSPLPYWGEIPLAWVMLYSGQTAIREDQERQDVIDARWPLPFPAAAEVGPHNLLDTEHSDTEPSTPPASGAVIVGNASARWQARTVSGDGELSPSGMLMVVGLQGRAVASVAPTEGQALLYQSGAWRPGTVSGGDGGGGATKPAIAPHWHADGPLAVLTEVDGIWRLTEDFRVDAVSLYLMELGTAGSTVVDVDRSADDGNVWSTIFSDPGDRPELPYNASDHIAIGIPGGGVVLAAGTLLRSNIVQVATGARCADIQLDGVSESGLELNMMPIMGIA